MASIHNATSSNADKIETTENSASTNEYSSVNKTKAEVFDDLFNSLSNIKPN